MRFSCSCAGLVALAFLCGCLAACHPRDGAHATPQAEPSERSLELRLDQPAEADGLSLTWLSVTDSRCPEGVTCIWAGEVTVKIEARDGGEGSELALTLGPRAADGDRAQTAHHELRLGEVTPYPREGADVARAARRAVVIVTPRRD